VRRHRHGAETGLGSGSDGQALRWSATDPPRDDTLADLNVRGPHGLRHTFATWLEDAGMPARVIDELIGHSGGNRGGVAPAHEGSSRCRHARSRQSNSG
jgi:integrase